MPPSQFAIKTLWCLPFLLVACSGPLPPSGPDAEHAEVANQDTLPDAGDIQAFGACLTMARVCLDRQQGCAIDAQGDAHCELCPKGEYPTGEVAACWPIEGTALSHAFTELTLAPGEEIGSLCQTWVLNNDEELWVHAVEFENDGGFHHSNWVFVPEGYNNWPTEPWLNCYQEGFSEAVAGLIGGVLYAQSTQTSRELQKFQTGAALRIPPHHQIMAPTHLLNFLPNDLTTQARLTLHTLPADEVSVKLTPIVLTNRALSLPKHASSEFRASCDFADPYTTFFDGPFAPKLHYVLPHYHDRAVGFELAIFGGDRDTEVLLASEGYGLDTYGRVFDPPIDLQGAKGLTFSCFYENDSNKKITWGIGDKEMCDMLGFVESDASLIGFVQEGTLQKLPNGDFLHTGECAASTVEFSQAKDGL